MGKRRIREKGFSLVEMLVYVGIISVILFLVVGGISSFIRSYTRFRVEREISTNIRNAMNVLVREISSAEDIYPPTSVFGAHPGQLTLETKINPPTGEKTTFVDFFVDDGQLFIKREGQVPLAISSDRMRVTNLIFSHFDPSGVGESVRIQLGLGYREGISRFEFQEERQLTSSVSLRGQY